MQKFEGDFNPDESDDEPLQSDVMLVAKMCSNLKKGSWCVLTKFGRRHVGGRMVPNI